MAKLKKVIAQRRVKHVKRRASERYGVKLTRQDVQSLTNICRRHSVIPIKKISNSRALYKISLNDIVFWCVYSKSCKQVVTVYPPEDCADYEEIGRKVKQGHSEHCASRIIWGDGECECGLY